MNKLRLSTKILIVSILTLLIFSAASFWILFHSLSKQASREMDQFLKNEALALSALVNSTGDNEFDFEMPSNFLNQFKQRNPNGFFLFIDPQNGKVLKQSNEAPHVTCQESSSNVDVKLADNFYRIETLLFKPELDREANLSASINRQSLCLIVGINKAPYQHVLIETLLSSIPILIFIVILLVTTLLIFIRGLTKDLHALTSALSTADFGGTHAFPILPKANTQEVKAIIDVLEELHQQASEVYREMWLFLGRAAHQIKTPVTAMQATLEVLLRKERSKEDLLAGLEDVRSAAVLLNGLTRKLMSSSKISYEERPATEAIDLLTFFKEMIEVFQSKANINGIQIIIGTYAPTKVLGNHTLMSDIFGNVIENAILYSPEHKGAHILISWHEEGADTVIEISDQGPGFPESIRSDLFKPFIRGDERKVVGSGLGLSIAKKSANLLGGDIELAESNYSGSKIRIWLHLAESDLSQ